MHLASRSKRCWLAQLAIPVLGFSLRTQLLVLGEAGREADWLLPSTSSHFRGPRAACCRRQGNDLTRSPAIGSLQRKEGPGSECVRDRHGHKHLSRPRAAGNWARKRRPRRPTAQRSAQLGATAPLLETLGRRRWPPSCKGAALTRPGPPRVRRSLPDSDWWSAVVRRYDWLRAIPPRPFTWSRQVRSGDARVFTPTGLSL